MYRLHVLKLWLTYFFFYVSRHCSLLKRVGPQEMNDGMIEILGFWASTFVSLSLSTLLKFVWIGLLWNSPLVVVMLMFCMHNWPLFCYSHWHTHVPWMYMYMVPSVVACALSDQIFSHCWLLNLSQNLTILCHGELSWAFLTGLNWFVWISELCYRCTCTCTSSKIDVIAMYSH